MGMPISNYTVLKALSSEGKQSSTRSHRILKIRTYLEALSSERKQSSTRSHQSPDWSQLHEPEIEPNEEICYHAADSFPFVLPVESGLAQSSEPEIVAAKAALAPFNLFAFIIHDPNVHIDFHRAISDIFDDLDYATGDKFLFFALVDPPEEWVTNAANRKYYNHLKSWEAKALLEPRNTIISKDKSIAALSLAKSLEIPIEELPCLVITTDFSFNDVHWVKTCPDHVMRQLVRLGSIAARSENLDLDILKNEIDLCGGSGFESLNFSMAKALSDVLSFVILENDVFHDEKHRALKQAQETLRELRDDLIQLKSIFRDSRAEEIDSFWRGKLDEQLDEELENLCVRIASFLALVNPRPPLNLVDFININEDFLEPDSITMLKTAHGVINFLDNPSSPRLSPADVDYTPGVICLAKVFEREINLSIVHWIRKSLGVELPTYFNKYQERLAAIYQLQREHINFNKQKGRFGDKWLPPGIGQSLMVHRHLTHGNPLTEPEQFLQQYWEKIKDVRNKAAHTDLVDKGSVSVVQAALNTLSRARVFDLLHQLKEQYRN